MWSGWLSTSPSWLNDTRRGARWPIGPQLRVWSCSASHSRCGEIGSDPNSLSLDHTQRPPKHKARTRATLVQPTSKRSPIRFFELCTFCSVSACSTRTLVATEKTSGCRLERRCLLASDQALTAIVEHQLHELLTQEASREARQVFRLPATAGFFPRTLSNRLSTQSKRTIDTRPHAPTDTEPTVHLVYPTCVVACHAPQLVGLHHASNGSSGRNCGLARQHTSV